MPNNKKQTSRKVASLAASVLGDEGSSAVAKRLAASALSQRAGDKQTGVQMEDVASKVLNSPKFNGLTKQLAASVLAQANKER